jgi:hypothetical protein
MTLFKKLALGLVLIQSACINRKAVCPDETELVLSFSQPVKEFRTRQSLNAEGSKIDTIPFTIYGLKDGRKYPFSNLPNLPVDISTNTVTYIFERPSRKDTLVIRYDLVRANCIHQSEKNSPDGIYLNVTNYSFIKNTFNESDTLINCALDAAFLYE